MFDIHLNFQNFEKIGHEILHFLIKSSHESNKKSALSKKNWVIVYHIVMQNLK